MELGNQQQRFEVDDDVCWDLGIELQYSRLGRQRGVQVNGKLQLEERAEVMVKNRGVFSS